MSILSNFTETFSSDNRHRFLCDDKEDDIVIGGTCKHVFRLPFVYSEYVSSMSIIYKQGFSVTIEKTDDDEDITINESEEYDSTIVTCQLNPDDTSLFIDTYLDTFVQLKIVNMDNEVIYDEPCKLVVRSPLEDVV